MGTHSVTGPGAGPPSWHGHPQAHGPGSNSSSGTPSADHAAKQERMTDREVWVASGCPVAGPNGWTQYQVWEGWCMGGVGLLTGLRHRSPVDPARILAAPTWIALDSL